MTAGVTRREDGFALRVLRVGVHPSALVMHVGTDVVVRTPARPDDQDGNVTDLLVPPDAASIPGRLETARRLMEPIGVRRAHLRYELPVSPATGAATGAAPDDPARAVALTAAGLAPRVRRVYAIDPSTGHADAPSVTPGITLERLTAPDDDVLVERRWYAASVLDRYAHGEDVTAWRAWDEAWGAWRRDRVRALAELRRAEVRLAARHSMPVAALTLLDDHDGLIVIEGLVTHPAHRRHGIARSLLQGVLASLQGNDAVTHIAMAVAPEAPAERLLQGAGFRPVADVYGWVQHTRTGTLPGGSEDVQG